jgi:hypothetical protein
MTKTPRHDVTCRTNPPSVGASTGARPITSMSRDRMVAAAVPANRSRTVAIATTATAALPIPWMTRPAMSSWTVGATAQKSDAAMCRASPAMSGRRRPTASASGPMSSCPRPIPTRIPVRVAWTADSDAPRSRVIDGSEGR